MHDQTLPNLLTPIFYEHPSRLCIIQKTPYRTVRYTYGEIGEFIRRTRTFFDDRGIKKGDKILVCQPNSTWWAVIYLAAAFSGIVLVPLDFNSTEEFIAQIFKQTKPSLIVTSLYKKPLMPKSATILLTELFPQEVLKYAPIKDTESTVQSDDLLEIMFTSGSTGAPKGVLLTHGNLAANLTALCDEIGKLDSMRFLSIIPLSHMFEQMIGFLYPLICGNSIVYPHVVRPNTIAAAMKKEEVTHIVCVPAFIRLFEKRIDQGIQHTKMAGLIYTAVGATSFLPQVVRTRLLYPVRREFGKSLRTFVSGGAPVSVGTEQYFERLGVHVLQGYGLTEAAPLVSLNKYEDKRVGSVGKPLKSGKIRIGENGEILLQGANITQGYFNNPEATNLAFEDGWFKTGDIGHIDDDGFLFIKGRSKNMIVTPSGMKVYPEDVEAVIMQLSGVRDCVVMDTGERDDFEIVAVILPHDAAVLDEKTILRHIQDKLASHQMVQRIVMWNEPDFPRTPTRKVIRKEVIGKVRGEYRKETGPNLKIAPADDQLTGLLRTISGAKKIKETDTLTRELHVDSMKRLELVSRLEDEMGKYVSESDIGADTTVSDLRNVLNTNSHQKKNNVVAGWQINEVMTFFRGISRALVLSMASYFQKVVVKGAVPAGGPYIFVANHTSHFDTVTVLRILSGRQRSRLAVAAAKDYFFKNPYASIAARFFINAFPLDRQSNVRESLESIGYLLDRGFSVLIFPEGTRSTSGNIKEFKAGIGMIAQEMGVPVIPIGMRGNDKILPKSAHLPKKGVTHVTIGGAITSSPLDSYITVSGEIEKEVEKLCQP